MAEIEAASAPKEISVSVRSLFATPVAVVALPGADEINAALRATILEREAGNQTTQHSNLGGWQSDWDLTEWGGPAAEAVFSAARTIASRLTSDRAGRAVEIEWNLSGWANINRLGHGNEFHTHPCNYWSICYYVDDGGIAADPALGGAFEIQDPRGVAPAMYAPLLALGIPGGQSVGANELIAPVAGNLLIFPAWLSHGVRPYLGDATRISIAFNLAI
jgi:uncharacterized protein (TIGR02466 family)